MTQSEKTWDVVIIGGGPAGMSAALWCSELGLDAVLIERSAELGGQLPTVYNPISNYPGLIVSNGSEMLEHFLRSVSKSRFPRVTGREAVGIDPDRMSVELSDGASLSARAIILATGVRRRRLGIEGELEFAGKGILESGARGARLVKGKRVLVVGGGDAALENASILGDEAAVVSVAFRKDRPSARDQFLNLVSAKKNVRLMPNTIVKQVIGESVVTGVVLQNVASGQECTEPTDHVLVRVGFEPNSEIVRDIVQMNSDSYIAVDANGQTNRPGIFAIGDVANHLSPTISTAVGTGSTAAKTVFHILHRNTSG